MLRRSNIDILCVSPRSLTPSLEKASNERRNADTDNNDEDIAVLELPEVIRNVDQWTVNQVQRWLESLDFSLDDRNIFKDNAIDGKRLLEFTDWILRDENGIAEGRLRNALTKIRAKFVIEGEL
ncbi:hypothetical protein HDU97_008558 [Phlyctochytrium planicorne]|nr:hypothetical protein HDU97_008558 [Phlyctochytrium planicorne]